MAEHARGLFLLLLVAMALSQFAVTAQDPCANCAPIAPCPGVNFKTVCSQAVDDVSSTLFNLGVGKQNYLWQLMAACIDDLGANGRLVLCENMDPGDFMVTLPDCTIPNPNPQLPPIQLWCPGMFAENCICINPGFMAGCGPTVAQGDPAGSLTIMMAALAHEACHGKSGFFASGDAGMTFFPPCAVPCNEVACACLELDILNCVYTSFPGSVALLSRISDVNEFKHEQTEQKVAQNCPL